MLYTAPIKTKPTTVREMIVLTLAFLIRQGKPSADNAQSGVNCRYRTRDTEIHYPGNVIPARDDVQEGTKGSREFVVEAMGEEWAAAMEGV